MIATLRLTMEATRFQSRMLAAVEHADSLRRIADKVLSTSQPLLDVLTIIERRQQQAGRFVEPLNCAEVQPAALRYLVEAPVDLQSKTGTRRFESLQSRRPSEQRRIGFAPW
jgi:hypothetical protein